MEKVPPESEVNGKIVEKTENHFLYDTDYAPAEINTHETPVEILHVIGRRLGAAATFAQTPAQQQSPQSDPNKVQHARDVLQGYLAERGRILPMAKSPEDVGFSSKRLERTRQAFKDDVEKKTLPGAVLVMVRNGKIVDL